MVEDRLVRMVESIIGCFVELCVWDLLVAPTVRKLNNGVVGMAVCV